MTADLSFLDLTPRKRIDSRWQPVTVRFLGAERYELVKVETESKLKFETGGFRVCLRKPLLVPAEKFFGKVLKEAMIHDIVIEFPEFEISSRLLYPEKFPRKVVEGDKVGVNG